jgi:uncharacterized membrane protein
MAPASRQATTCDTVRAGSSFEETPVMKLIAFYIVFVLIGDLIAYFVGRTMEQFATQSLSLTVFLACFFVVFWVAWVLAVRVTKPKSA